MGMNENDSYYYEEFPVEDYRLYTTFYVFIILLGLFGNIFFLCTVVYLPRMRTITNIYLASLSVADLVFIILYLPVEISLLFTISWKMGEFACVFSALFLYIAVMVTAWNLVVLSISKYYVVVGPFTYNILSKVNSSPKRILITLWILCTTLAYPLILIQEHDKAYAGEEYCYPHLSTVSKLFAFVFYEFMLIVLVPTGVMSYSYLKIFATLRRASTRSAGTVSNRITETQLSENQVEPSNHSEYDAIFSDPDKERQEAKMLLVISIVYIFTYFPEFLSFVLITVSGTSSEFFSLLYAIHFIFCSSCFLKPVIYFFMSTYIREGYLEIGRTCLRRASDLMFRRFY